MQTKDHSDKNKHPLNQEKITILQSRLIQCENELAQAKQELKEKTDKLLRSYADLQNYQKRIDKECIDKERECRKKYLLEFIEMYEILQKAYHDNDPKSGLKILLQSIEQFFGREHMKAIECAGKTFDHTCHHAISMIERDDCVDDIIVDEVQKGYFLDEQLLRPAQVIVAKKKIMTNMEGL